MARIIGVVTAFVLSSFVIAGVSFAEDRIECFESCDTKMMACLDPCPRDENGDFQRDCRNVCAIDTFHPCLDKCPHPRTGLSPAQKRQMQELEKEQKEEQAAQPKS